VRALITGGAGQLGHDLTELLGPDSAFPYSHAELDISDPSAIERTVAEVEPDVIFNCAAFHNVDECEREREPAWRINVEAVRNLAAAGPKLVHLSTNYVFDGANRAEPYPEDHLPSPQSIYALTKLAGEYAALAYGERPLVVRGSGLYGTQGNASKGGNFIERIIAGAQKHGELAVVADQRLQPTFTVDLAKALVEAVEAEAEGVLHLTASGECSWHEYTETIMELAGIDVPVAATETTVPEGGAARPLNGVLARPRADGLGLTPLRHWREALEDYMAQAGLRAAGATSDGKAR
jgi:dTDP-4-dehydrorhamnose reductase